MNFSCRVLRSCIAALAAAFLAYAPPAARAADVTPVMSVKVPVLAEPPSMGGTLDASWEPAAKLTLGQDFTYRRPVDEATEVRVAQDGSSLDIVFVVTQREPRTEAQQTNGSSVTSDDYVGVYLFPQGTTGFQYGFFANPRGTRHQFSSENSAYTPQWTAVGHPTATGYIVTMRIPLNVIRSGGSTSWRAQFVRATVATGGLAVWAYAGGGTGATDPAFAGTLLDIGTKATALRPKPRAQLYSLAQVTTPRYGGSTSRIGADFAIPVTPTASFVGTLHPDFSNVEIDQQTIAPSAFAYQFAEVRPFFTQAGQAFNYSVSCSDCPQLLYTPAIPTFREGYALEGTQGPVTFGAFDAIGNGRVDQGQAFDYNTSNTRTYTGANFQRIAVDTRSGIHDELNSFQGGYGSQKTHFFVYGNVAFERGSLVTIPGQANYLEYGGGYADSTAVVVANAQRVGAQFAPVDSFVSQTDLTGYELYGRKLLTFRKGFFLRDVQFTDFYARYHDSAGRTNQTDASENLTLDFKNLLTFRINRAATGVQIASGEFLPFHGDAFLLGYKVNTGTPSYVRHSFGAYYHGQLDAYNYLTVLPLRKRLRLTLQTDEDKYFTTYPGESPSTLWLERASLDFQLTKDASFDVGARRIIGGFLPNAFQPPPFGHVNAGNVSLAFHYLSRSNEFYVVYGDPNSLSTTPALFLKWIRYVGAPKGT
ncbi:MAG TPA: hypothetical protein VN224_07250 [Xanthomonadales bacterium]|nr:hypothetical protein [Xanthomonadales bacterium]